MKIFRQRKAKTVEKNGPSRLEALERKAEDIRQRVDRLHQEQTVITLRTHTGRLRESADPNNSR